MSKSTLIGAVEQPLTEVSETGESAQPDGGNKNKLKALNQKWRARKAKCRQKQRTPVTLLLSQLYLILLSAGTVLTAQLFQPQGADTLKKVAEVNPGVLFVTFLVILLFSEFFYLISLKPWLPAAVIYPVISIMTLIGGLKLQFRGEPLVFSDFFLIKEAFNVAGDYGIKMRPIYYVSVLALLFMLWLPSFFKKFKPRIRIRILVAAVTIAAFIPLSFLVFIGDGSLLASNYINSVWNPRLEYENNGVIAGFIHNTQLSMMLPPDNYSKKSVEEAAERLGYAPRPVGTDLSDEEKPNIIVVMNECFWDTDFMTATRFTPDPLLNLRSIGEGKDAGFGYTLSPQFGGGTANVEYEFLTGMSMRYHQATNIIYQNSITEKTWSLAWYFRSLGYETQAIHPYFDWYWHRNRNYPLMGFENMYFKDTMHNTQARGPFISDESAGKEIMARVPKASDKPIFTFVVTMQNHGPHKGGQYNSFFTEISGLEKNENLSKRAHDYAEGAYDSDALFAALCEHYKDAKRPTYILMFGDHAPPVANQDGLFGGGKASIEDKFNMQRTPVILWSNTGKEIPEIQNTSDFMLGTVLLKTAGLPLTGYQATLERLMDSTRGFTFQYTLDAKGQPVKETEELTQKIDDLGLLQYDASFGKHYVADLFTDTGE